MQWPSNWAGIVLAVTSFRTPTIVNSVSFVIFFRPSRQISGYYLRLSHDNFLAFPVQFVTLLTCSHYVLPWYPVCTFRFMCAQEDCTMGQRAVPDLQVPRLRPIRWSRQFPGQDHTTSTSQIPGIMREQRLSDACDILICDTAYSEWKLKPPYPRVSRALQCREYVFLFKKSMQCGLFYNVFCQINHVWL